MQNFRSLGPVLFAHCLTQISMIDRNSEVYRRFGPCQDVSALTMWMGRNVFGRFGPNDFYTHSTDTYFPCLNLILSYWSYTYIITLSLTHENCIFVVHREQHSRCPDRSTNLDVSFDCLTSFTQEDANMN